MFYGISVKDVLSQQKKNSAREFEIGAVCHHHTTCQSTRSLATSLNLLKHEAWDRNMAHHALKPVYLYAQAFRRHQPHELEQDT